MSAKTCSEALFRPKCPQLPALRARSGHPGQIIRPKNVSRKWSLGESGRSFSSHSNALPCQWSAIRTAVRSLHAGFATRSKCPLSLQLTEWFGHLGRDADRNRPAAALRPPRPRQPTSDPPTIPAPTTHQRPSHHPPGAATAPGHCEEDRRSPQSWGYWPWRPRTWRVVVTSRAIWSTNAWDDSKRA